MPSQQELDEKAHDYGVLVAGINKLRAEEQALKSGNAALAEQRGLLNDELEKTRAAKDRVRGELIDLEKERDAFKAAAKDELEAEKRVLAEQRAGLSKGLEDMKAIEKNLDARELAVGNRERILREAEKTVEAKGKAQLAEDSRLDTLARSLETREAALNARSSQLDAKASDVARRLKDAETAESHQRALMETTKRDAKQASDDRLAANAKIAGLNDLIQRNEGILAKIQQFCDVADDARHYIGSHIGDQNAIQAYIDAKFPEVTQALLASKAKNV